MSGQHGPLTELCRISLQGMYEYGVEYGIIQDGEISEVRLRGNIFYRPLIRRACLCRLCLLATVVELSPGKEAFNAPGNMYLRWLAGGAPGSDPATLSTPAPQQYGASPASGCDRDAVLNGTYFPGEVQFTTISVFCFEPCTPNLDASSVRGV